MTTHNGYFRGRIAVVTSPRFRLLPFDLVATDSHGRRVGTQRIPTSAFYSDWNRVEPNLSAYRKAHGCNATPPRWRCLSR
jgi:hypothetical protein